MFNLFSTSDAETHTEPCSQPSHVSRRTFLTGIGATAGAAATPSISQSSIGGREELVLDINVYVNESLRTLSTKHDRDPLHTAQVTKLQLEALLPTLSTKSIRVIPDVTIVEEVVPNSLIDVTSVSDTLSNFEEYLADSSSPSAAFHSNLLLLNDDEFGAIMTKGIGRVPDWGTEQAPATPALQLDASNLLEFDLSEFPKGVIHSDNNELTTGVHEVGHNLGIHHMDGEATKDSSWVETHGYAGDVSELVADGNDVVYSSIMLTGYPEREEFAGKRTNHGEKIPNATPDNTEIVLLPTFSDNIDLSHLLPDEKSRE